MSEEEISESEAANLVRKNTQARQTVPAFFSDVVYSDDTTKMGNLDVEELGNPKLPLRTYKELELFSSDVAGEENWKDYFQKMSEIQTSTSLSKDAILLRLVVTQKKELADVTPKSKKVNKGWFKKKNGSQESE